MSLFRKNNAEKPVKGEWVAVFETDGRILREAGPGTFAGRTLVVGRARDCDWCTAGVDGTLSSRHAELFLRRGRLCIRDLGSRNGLYFRGERIKEHRFAPGDAVLLGSCKISVEAARASAAAGGMEFHRLEWLNGPDAGNAVDLRADAGAEIGIGSDPVCAIRCFDTLVSRHHASLSLKKDGSCWIRDAGSRNGTTVNGIQLAKDKERMLRDGDVVGVAHLEFRFLDKDAVHVNARVGRKLLVAAATVAVATALFSVWNATRTDAGRLLARSLRAAETWTPDQEDFSEAFDWLERAAEARQADVYRASIKERHQQLVAWTNTIVAWKAVRADLARGRWKSARGRFNRLSSWNWNASTAPAARRESETAQTLVNAFLDARDDLSGSDWTATGAAETKRFEADIDRLSAALADAPDPAKRKWAAPVVGESEALLAEFRIETNELALVAASLAPLVPTAAADPAPDAAAAALSRLDALIAENDRRRRIRLEETVSFGGGKPAPRPQPFFSTAVAACAAAAKQPLAGLAGAEAVVARNIRLVAEGRFDSVRKNLPFPDRVVTDSRSEFLHYREWLETKNGLLCGETVLGEWKARLAALVRRGFDPGTGDVPAAFKALRDPGFAAGILEFVPAGSPDPFVSADAPVCAYDRFAGARAMTAFLGALRHKRGFSQAADVYDNFGRPPAKCPWRTVLQDVRAGLSTLRGFDRFANGGGSVLVRAVRDAEVPGGVNKCREAARFAAAELQRTEDWFESFADRCAESGRKRDALLGAAVSLLVAGSPSENDARALGAAYSELQEEMWNVSGEMDEGRLDYQTGWRTILRTVLPSDDKAWTDSLRGLSPEGGNP